MSDFKGDDYEFAAGSIYGMRSWGMDDQGRLHGVTHREAWRPGENVSVCKAVKRVPCPDAARAKATEIVQYRSTFRDEMSFRVWDPPEPCGKHPDCFDGTHPAPSGHSFDPDCQCGFWAYDEHTFTSHGDVTGIIEGYGKTTIGTRGFRCEKARIVALLREHKDGYLSLSAWFRLQRLYPDAAFYDEIDEMVGKHGSVLRTWPEVGDDFWDQPVPRGDYYSISGAVMSGTLTISPSAFKWAGGI